jgi:hypothetical protein
MPISARRRVTPYAVTPYSPSPASSSANPPKREASEDPFLDERRLDLIGKRTKGDGQVGADTAERGGKRPDQECR